MLRRAGLEVGLLCPSTAAPEAASVATVGEKYVILLTPLKDREESLGGERSRVGRGGKYLTGQFAGGSGGGVECRSTAGRNDIHKGSIFSRTGLPPLLSFCVLK